MIITADTDFDKLRYPYVAECLKHDSKYLKVSPCGTFARVHFKFMGLPKPFTTKKQSLADARRELHRIGNEIYKLESVDLDLNTGKRSYPFTTWQINQILATFTTLCPKIQAAFTQKITFESVYTELCEGKKRADQRKNRLKDITFFNQDINSITSTQIRDQYIAFKSWSFVNNPARLLSEQTVSQYQDDIVKTFNSAQSRQLLVTNPCSNVKMIDDIKARSISDETRRDPFSKEEQREIHAAAEVMDDAPTSVSERTFAGYHQLLTRLGMSTGARADDLHEARWSEFTNIMNDQCQWSFRMRKFKSSDTRWSSKRKYVVTHDIGGLTMLMALLRAAYQNRTSDYVFENRKGKLKHFGVNNIGTRIEYIIAKANALRDSQMNHNSQGGEGDVERQPITGYPHKMRHTMVSNIHSVPGLASPWQYAADKCGHTDEKTTKKYYGKMVDETYQNNEVSMAQLLNDI